MTQRASFMQTTQPQHAENDISEQLSQCVREACATSTKLLITGSGSKSFYGRRIAAEPLDVSDHRGIVAYEPSELVITARSGTPLAELEDALNRSGQMLGFEPPRFGTNATLGGTIACGFSGPRRPFVGSARDFVLGVKIINGRGKLLGFGGQVMKNVAGYDVSRLMTGAMGTLGVLTEVSLKVLPAPEMERTLLLELEEAAAMDRISQLLAQSLPISAICYHDSCLRVRLSGTEAGIKTAQLVIGGEASGDEDFWLKLREHQLNFFQSENDLWRLSVPFPHQLPEMFQSKLIDWSGSQIWAHSERPADTVWCSIANMGGSATLFRAIDRETEKFPQLSKPLAIVHERLKRSFDPERILNPGIMYADL